MARDYSGMTVEELEGEIKEILSKQNRQDDLFRLAVFIGQLDLAKHIYHDRKYLPDARHGSLPSRALEISSYGQALVQLLMLMHSRGLDFGKVFEYAVEHMKDDEWKERVPENHDEVKGLPVSGGMVTGNAYVVSRESPVEKAPKGSILVIEHGNSEVSPYLNIMEAVVTDHGGKLSHLATVAREMGKPAVIGTGNATKRIRTGDRIMVDADKGTVVHV